MKLRLAHYRNRFSMFRTYYALGAGLVKTDGLAFTVVEVPDPPSRELEEALIRGDVDLANIYLPNFLERRLDGAPIIGLCTEWKSTRKGNGLFVRRGAGVRASEATRGSPDRDAPRSARHSSISAQECLQGRHRRLGVARKPARDLARIATPRRSRRRRTARPVLLSRRAGRRYVVPLYGRRRMEAADRIRRNDQTHGRGERNADQEQSDDPRLSPSGAAGTHSLTANAIWRRSPTSSWPPMAATVRR